MGFQFIDFRFAFETLRITSYRKDRKRATAHKVGRAVQHNPVLNSTILSFILLYLQVMIYNVVKFPTIRILRRFFF